MALSGELAVARDVLMALSGELFVARDVLVELSAGKVATRLCCWLVASESFC